MVLFQSGMAAPIARAMLSVNWLLVLGALRGRELAGQLGGGERRLAARPVRRAWRDSSPPRRSSSCRCSTSPTPWRRAPSRAPALLTAIGFAGLTAIAFATRKDFSFLGALLRWAFVVALLAIVGAVLFGFELGTWFSVAMVGLAGAAILHDTSNVMLRFPEDRYVAAALQLFASVALLFWYLLRIFMGNRR